MISFFNQAKKGKKENNKLSGKGGRENVEI